MGPILFLFGIILGLRWLLWKTADNARRRTNSNMLHELHQKADKSMVLTCKKNGEKLERQYGGSFNRKTLVYTAPNGRKYDMAKPIRDRTGTIRRE